MTIEPYTPARPVAIGADPASGPPFTVQRKDYSAADPSGHLTVMVIDDNLTDVWLVNEALDENGINPELFVAADGEEALLMIDRIDNSRLPCPHLMVLDLNLPKGSGFEVLKRIRSSPRCGNKPVAIFSSSNALADRQEAARLGATAYIEKPSNLSDLPAVGRKLKELMMGSRTQ